ncbi:MAG: aminoglycoside phosphotransferase family protein [Oscillospiraceae bacterium]|nr:aminoglycoside phosphotransferase family protein [Oscillospiraceae bacterium]
MNLFTANINNWQEWGEIFQSIPAFAPLVEHILRKENLPVAKIENLTPGTNAVFKVGDYVVKIFAPAESGIDQTLDLQTELFSTRRANEIGVSAPKLIADGFAPDKYRFGYMITEYINGVELEKAVKTMSDEEKILIGQKLRKICDKMNTPCEPFNGIDIINDKGRYRRWDNYPERFKTERLEYIKTHDFGQNVFVHGDLCLDNILLSPEGELFIIDFADAVLAPVIYEHALAAYAFEFDPFLLRGYFSDYTADGFIEMFFNGLLIHDFGGAIIGDYFGKPNEILSLDNLRERLCELIKLETEKRA